MALAAYAIGRGGAHRGGYPGPSVRSFACDTCGQLVFFENTVCLRCGSDLGFEPGRRELVTLSPGAARCANLELAGCNWLVGAPGELCASCRLTRTRPADDDAEGIERFRDAEAAKRWLLFELGELGAAGAELARARRRPGLRAALQRSRAGDHRPRRRRHHARRGRVRRRPPRGAARAARRALPHRARALPPRDRPLLLAAARARRAARASAAARCSATSARTTARRSSATTQAGRRRDWSQRFVSAYATMHPWEDWAETFAHYLHIWDTLQTAGAFGVNVRGRRGPGARRGRLPGRCSRTGCR